MSDSKMMSDRIVWIVQDRGGMDFSNAVRYGEVKIIYDNDPNPFDLRTLYNIAKERLAGSGPNDFLVLVGNLQMVSVASVAFVERWGALRTLIYRAQSREYVSRALYINAVENQT